MTQLEFLLQLEDELKLLPRKNRKEIIKFYQDKINQSLDYGEEEHKVISKLPLPKDIANDAYQSKGKLYQVKRQKQIRNKNIIQAIGSALLILIMLLVLIGITSLALLYMKNKLIMMGSFLSSKLLEWILTESFLFVYLIISVFTLLFIFDLSLIIVNLLLVNFRPLFKSNRQGDLINFSFRGIFAKICKKPKIIENMYLILIIVLVGLGILGFVNKTYIYRSMTGTHRFTEKYDISDAFKTIKIKNYEAIINFQISDDEVVKIKHQYEFDKNFVYEIIDEELILMIDDPKSYDLLGLIKEPMQAITISIPSNLVPNINIALEKGTVYINKVELDDVEIELIWGNIEIKESAISSISAVLDEVNFGCEKSIVGTIDIKANRGKINSQEDTINQMEIETKSSTFNFKDLTISNFEIKGETPTIKFDNIDATNGKLSFQVGIINFKNIMIEEDLSIYSSGQSQLLLDDIKSNTLEVDFKGSLTGHKINSDFVIKEGTEGNIYLSVISGNLSINNSGGELEILNSDLQEFNLVSRARTNLIQNTESQNSHIEIIKGICELSEFYGSRLDLIIDNSNLTFINTSLANQFEEINEEFKNISTRVVEGVYAKEWNK